MSDTIAPVQPAAAGGLNGELMDIGTVAAHNIAQALGIAEDKVYVVRDAIRNEIQTMGSHFTSAVADVQDHYAGEIAKAKAEVETTKANLIAQAKIDVDAFKAKLAADFSFVEEHKLLIAGAIVALTVLGAILGHLV